MGQQCVLLDGERGKECGVMMQRHEVSDEEIRAVTRVYEFASKVKRQEIDLRKGKLSAHVGKVMNTSYRTVERIIKEHRRGDLLNRGFQFRRGRHSRVTVNIVEEIRAYVLPRSEKGLPTSVGAIRNMLLQLGFDLAEATIRRTLHNMGFTWGPGRRRRVAAERPENVLFRTQYLRSILQNRGENNKPTLPMIFIDESFIHLHHSAQRSWIHDINDKLFGVAEGKGARFVIVGAGVIYQMNGVFRGKWMENSVRVWNSTSRKRRGRGRQGKRDEGTSSSSSSDFEEDYHGNMNARKFEKWFVDVCAEASIQFGNCIIVMDGCSAHKRVLNPSPNKSSTKPAMMNWLRRERVEFDASLTRAELLAIVDRVKPEKKYVTVGMAERVGHKVLFTPPYHPELQPIETIWGFAKTKSACGKKERLQDSKIG